MKAIYIADDGKQFNEEWDCLEYEFKLSHSNYSGIHIYGSNKELSNPFNPNTYFSSDKVVIDSEDAYKDFIEICRMCGWLEWGDEIDSPGSWIYTNKLGWEKL